MVRDMDYRTNQAWQKHIPMFSPHWLLQLLAGPEAPYWVVASTIEGRLATLDIPADAASEIANCCRVVFLSPELLQPAPFLKMLGVEQSRVEWARALGELTKFAFYAQFRNNARAAIVKSIVDDTNEPTEDRDDPYDEESLLEHAYAIYQSGR